MVQDSLLSVDKQQLAQILGTAFNDENFNFCQKKLEIFDPDVGQQFWLASSAPPGICIVLTGKVRLVNPKNELVKTLNQGDSWGENTIFNEASFLPYWARASTGVRIGYLSEELLKKLNGYYLESQAVMLDWLLLCPQIAALHKQPGFGHAFSLLQRNNLPIGNLPNSLKNRRFWLLRRGQMVHTSGWQLDNGSIYTPRSKEGSWQITQPMEIYSLDDSTWHKALEYLPQLAQLVSSDDLQSGIESPGNNVGRVSSDITVQQRGWICATKGLPACDPRIPHAQFKTPNNPKKQVQPTKSSTPPVIGNKISQAYFPKPTLQIGHLWQRIAKRYPFFQQQSASDCGAASLVMVGQYWGKRFSVNRLREISGADRNGASLRGLVLAAESIGFTTRPVKTNLEQLANLVLPIAHWEGKHYIVVYQVTHTQVIVGDPGIGQLSLTHVEFETGWTGYTLLLQPTALLKNATEGSIPCLGAIYRASQTPPNFTDRNPFCLGNDSGVWTDYTSIYSAFVRPSSSAAQYLDFKRHWLRVADLWLI